MHYEPKKFTLHTIQGISAETLSLHIGLYEGYVKHVNVLHDQLVALAHEGEKYAYTIGELRRRFGFEWDGMRLHELYFGALEGGSKPLLGHHTLYTAIAKQYGSFSAWLEIFNKVSARGPGWALLTYDPEVETFFHVWVAEHEIGNLATLPVLIAVDHWEHAYLKDYAPAEKATYVQAYLQALNWEKIEERFNACKK